MTEKPIRIPHVMITASAGSGKTWQLTNRILTLILSGAPPESIIALTFTRKAAGEFFDAVLGRLAGAAGDPQKAAGLCRDLGIEPHPPEYFLAPLRTLVAGLHRLQFTTIDSFFHRIVSSFPFELGLSGAFSLMDGYEAGRARVQVLEQILRRSGGGRDAAARKNFLQNFKQATFGIEAKSPAANLDQYVQDLHALYQEIPDTERWGGAALPESLVRWGGPEAPFNRLEEIRRGLAQSGAKEAGLEAWDEWGPALVEWKPATAIGASTYHTIRKNILKSYQPPDRVCGEFNLARNKIRPNAALAADLGALVELWMGREIRHRIELTQGVGKILAGYDLAYDRMVRRSGRLVFSDLPRVIGPVFEGDAARLDLDYRLDARFDHWLLDEFQDTSRVQWQVLENLVDEVVQDPGGGRSFFCVGDVKQSIYAWRGGDHRLLGELRRRYGDRIEEESLVTTYRCSGAVVDLVNRAMGHPGLGGLLPGADVWAGLWKEHQSKRPGTGFAAYLEAPEKAEEDEMDPCHWMISHLIRQIDPPGRGLTCAVLTYSNEEARALADFLRTSTPYPVILEGEIRPAGDNMLGRLALAWVMALDHPQDSLAEGWLRASPVGSFFSAEAGDWRAETWARIHRGGFGAVLEGLFDHLAKSFPLDAFHQLRRRQILDAVRDFESEGSRDAGALAAYLESRTLKAPDVPGAIEVMTIFKAKGLGFDVVFVTELARKNNSMNRARKGPLVCRNARREAEWLLFPPTSLFTGVISDLGERVEEGIRENVYEQLCLLYVALTRAKEALYIIGEGKISDGESVTPQHVLRQALVGDGGGDSVPLGDMIEARAVFGSPDWFCAHGVRPPAAAISAKEPSFDFPVEAEREEWTVLPSGSEKETSAVRDLLNSTRRASRRTGNRVHALFAQIGNAGDKIEGSGPEVEQVRSCLAEKEIRDLFPAGEGVRIWREKAFQVVAGGRVVRGVFDRVLVRLGQDGKPAGATLVDFKTDAVGAGDESRWAEGHRRQMEMYREALAILLELKPDRIQGRLVSVALRRVVALF
jgi:ATP-dependent helicase/nuclease subunit A